MPPWPRAFVSRSFDVSFVGENPDSGKVREDARGKPLAQRPVPSRPSGPRPWAHASSRLSHFRSPAQHPPSVPCSQGPGDFTSPAAQPWAPEARTSPLRVQGRAMVGSWPVSAGSEAGGAGRLTPGSEEGAEPLPQVRHWKPRPVGGDWAASCLMSTVRDRSTHCVLRKHVCPCTASKVPYVVHGHTHLSVKTNVLSKS